jgi:DNA-binding sugar fermentation-stimulating protein
MKPARDKKGNLVGPNDVSAKFGTPKCEYIAQLLRVDESHLTTAVSSSSSSCAVQYPAVWVGAHPSLGEKIAEQLIGQNLLQCDDFPEVQSFQREVRNPAGLDLRADFVVTHTDPTKRKRIVEVKTVVDTDYSPDAVPPLPSQLQPSSASSPEGKKKISSNKRCVFTSSRVPYRRTAIFPWGNSNQKGPDGEPVVSTRAIKHVRELTRAVVEQKKNRKSTKKTNDDGTGDEEFDSTILFVVIRGDAKAFRPNIDACPSFARYLKEAQDAGVNILAKQVVWGEERDKELGKCYEGPLLEIEWP